jgi:hypothetical protein
MISAAKDNLSAGGEDIVKYGQSVFENEKSKIETLTTLLISGSLSQDDFNSRIDDVKMTVESQLLAEQAIAKSTAQKAINAAMDVLSSAILTALKPPI